MPSRSPQSHVLGIIGCEIFEDEIAHVVYNDLETPSVFVIDSEESKGIVNKIRMLDPEKKVVRMAEDWLETAHVPKQKSVIIWMKPISLHQSPAKLREDVTAAIYRMKRLCSSILLFYGICGNAFRGVDEVAKRARANVTILRDGRGYIVDDCTCTVIGGTEEYLEQLRSSSLAFHFTPMWAANWRRFFNEFQILRDPDDMESAQIIFENMGYDKVVKMDTGLGNRRAFTSQILEFSGKFNLKVEEFDCTLRVVDNSYRRARRTLEGE